jgi:hypothetical protein
MELSDERDANERRVSDAPSDAAPCGYDVWDGMLGEKIVGPLRRCVYRK